jgi:hypothetical protein
MTQTCTGVAALQDPSTDLRAVEGKRVLFTSNRRVFKSLPTRTRETSSVDDWAELAGVDVAEVDAGVSAAVQRLLAGLSAEVLVGEAWTALDFAAMTSARELYGASVSADEAVLLRAGQSALLFPTATSELCSSSARRTWSFVT